MRVEKNALGGWLVGSKKRQGSISSWVYTVHHPHLAFCHYPLELLEHCFADIDLPCDDVVVLVVGVVCIPHLWSESLGGMWTFTTAVGRHQ